MKIERGFGVHLLKDEELSALNARFNQSHPGVNATITVGVDWRNEDGSAISENDDDDEQETCKSRKIPVMRYVLSYKHDLSLKDKSYIIVEQAEDSFNVIDGIENTLNTYIKQTTQCNHHFVRPLDVFGKEYPDGRGMCSDCGLEISGILPKKDGKVISMSCSKDVVAQYDWGNAYLQGGDSGLVLKSDGKSYQTAFMEAFPTIHGFGTFLRGEGTDIHAAEKACWDSYQKKLNCTGHEWTREVRGEYRKDGYAQCVHCGLCTNDALQPETLCRVCKTPTSHQIGDDFICLDHYYQLSEDERAAAYVQMMSDSRDHADAKVEYDFDYRFISRIQAYVLSQVGHEQYRLIKDQLRGVLGFARINFYQRMLDMHPLKAGKQYGDDAFAKMEECHAHIIKNWPTILEYLNGVLANKKLINEPLKKLRGVHVSDVIPEPYITKPESQE